VSALPLPSVISPLARIVPVTLIVILSAPAWLTWPFLSESKQRTVLQMVDALARWTRGDLAAMEDKAALNHDTTSCGIVFERGDEGGKLLIGDAAGLADLDAAELAGPE
jgi:hypothetical protein